jgi:hypothetical protein
MMTLENALDVINKGLASVIGNRTDHEIMTTAFETVKQELAALQEKVNAFEQAKSDDD